MEPPAQPPRTPTPDWPQPPLQPHEPPIRGDALRRMAVSVLLIVVVGWLAFYFTREPAPAGRQNLIELAVQPVRATLEATPDGSDETQVFLEARFGINVDPPEIVDAEIDGVGYVEYRKGMQVPVVFYEDPHGDIGRLHVFTYALLDTWARGLFIERSARLEIEQGEMYSVVPTDGDREVVLWRRGDDIFIAVAEQGAGRLIPRIR